MRHHLYNPGFKFVVEPEHFNKYTDRELLQYCLGATMYMPGTKDFAPKILSGAMPGLTTIVLCFEDACPEDQVEEAEANVHKLLDTVTDAVDGGTLSADKVPLIFVRIRNLAQFKRFGEALTKKQARALCGINFPKFNAENGYEYYGCESSKGLGAYNKDGYNKLRKDFNSKKERDDEYYLMLYLLIVYSFNNQLRYNRKGEFNLPVGKRDFNLKMQQKLEGFLDRIKSGDYAFTTGDFREVNIDEFTDKSFFYVDPPYLITCATYNEQDGWNEQDEYDLLAYLEEVDKKGIRFALSNVLESKGKKNEILADWIEKHKKFKAISLDYDYKNSNYHTKREGVTKEVLVVNY